MSQVPDFYVPYAGGHLPMVIIQLDVTHEGGYTGPREVTMDIKAVSCGPPVFTSPPAPISARIELEGPES